MTDYNPTNATMGEPVTEQPPGATLPENYLDGGYYATSDKGASYLKPDYVDRYARSIAADLAMKPNDFASLLRGLKSAKKRTLPFEARQTATAELLPKSLALVRRKKAAPLLVLLIQSNIPAVHTDEDFNAFYRHCEAIFGYLSLQGGDAL